MAWPSVDVWMRLLSCVSTSEPPTHKRPHGLAHVPGGRPLASGLAEQPARRLGVVSDSTSLACQDGFSGERYSSFPCITVCDTIDLILTPSPLSGLHSNKWPGRHRFPRVSVKGNVRVPFKKNSFHLKTHLRIISEGKEPSGQCRVAWKERGQGPAQRDYVRNGVYRTQAIP